jgi:hypothetical protein
MQFGGGKFNQPDNLMRPEARIHKLSIQCKTGSITFRETGSFKIEASSPLQKLTRLQHV